MEVMEIMMALPGGGAYLEEMGMGHDLRDTLQSLLFLLLTLSLPEH